MNLFRNGNYLTVILSSGKQITVDSCTDELWEKLKASEEPEVLKLLIGEDYKDEQTIKELIASSAVLILRGASVYMPGVSEISIPSDFALEILKAEQAGDTVTVQKYVNFWTLVSLNPDARVRNNLFWFIRKWNVTISQSGLLIAFRNADIKRAGNLSQQEVKEVINRYYNVKYLEHGNPAEINFNETYTLEQIYQEIMSQKGSPVYTDHHSRSTEIRLGQPVSIPREECDPEQEHSCSKGLHCGGKGWLEKGYYGDVGLMVLVNPAKVVAVPK